MLYVIAENIKFNSKFNSIQFKCLKIHLNCPPWLEKILKYTSLKCLKTHLNCPPWLENNLKDISLKCLKIHLKLSTTVGKKVERYFSQMFENTFKIIHHGWRKS